MPIGNVIIVIIESKYEVSPNLCYETFCHSMSSVEDIASELKSTIGGDFIIVYPDGFKVPCFTDVIKDILKPTRFDNDNIMSLERGCQELMPKIGFMLEKKYRPDSFDNKTSIIFIAYHSKKLCQEVPKTPNLDRYDWQNVKRYDKKGLTWLEYIKQSQVPP